MEQTHDTAVMERPAPRTLPTPPDFPVTWESPEDATIFWTRDVMHFGGTMTPLDSSYMLRFAPKGFGGAAEAYSLPIRSLSRRINTYYYNAYVPITTDPEILAALGAEAERRMGAAMATFGDDWKNVFLPEIMGYVADWESFDLRGATMPALIAHLDASLVRTERLMVVHFLVGAPMLLAMSLFDEFYRDLFGTTGSFDSFKLQQGFLNKSVEAGQALWRLSRAALASETVRAILASHDAGDVLAALDGSAAGRAFRAELDAYLRAFGKRSNTWFVVSETPWIEDPTPVIRNLKEYLTLQDHDPEAEMAALAAEREALLAEARAKLAGYPEAVVGQFEFLLKAAQTGTVLQEDHAFWIDFRSTYEVHRIISEFARRFVAAGALATPGEIAYLTVEEIRAAAMTDLAAFRPAALIAERKAEIAHFAAVQPPMAIGTEPPGPPPDDPISRAMGKFFGGPPQLSEEPDTLKGNAGSPGLVRGRAKVLRSLDDAGKLQKGDILVAETTAPPWTPLFATAAAVVTDTGGILSHCAVVAREYMIPAVVGTGFATARIQDGMVIEVDGDAGTVRIIAE